MSISLCIAGQPISYRVKGQSNAIYETREALKAQYDAKPIKGPVSVDVCFYIYPPKWARARVENGDVIVHTSKPDLSYLSVFIEKAIQHVAIRDTSQIVRIQSRKLYDLNPRTEIRIDRA